MLPAWQTYRIAIVYVTDLLCISFTSPPWIYKFLVNSLSSPPELGATESKFNDLYAQPPVSCTEPAHAQPPESGEKLAHDESRKDGMESAKQPRKGVRNKSLPRATKVAHAQHQSKAKGSTQVQLPHDPHPKQQRDGRVHIDGSQEAPHVPYQKQQRDGRVYVDESHEPSHVPHQKQQRDGRVHVDESQKSPHARHLELHGTAIKEEDKQDNAKLSNASHTVSQSETKGSTPAESPHDLHQNQQRDGRVSADKEEMNRWLDARSAERARCMALGISFEGEPVFRMADCITGLSEEEKLEYEARMAMRYANRAKAESQD